MFHVIRLITEALTDIRISLQKNLQYEGDNYSYELEQEKKRAQESDLAFAELEKRQKDFYEGLVSSYHKFIQKHPDFKKHR